MSNWMAPFYVPFLAQGLDWILDAEEDRRPLVAALRVVTLYLWVVLCVGIQIAAVVALAWVIA